MIRIERFSGTLSAGLDAWGQLALGAPASMQPAYALAAVRSGACDERDVLLLFATAGTEVVGLWPLRFCYEERGPVTLRHIGHGSNEEYAGPIIRPGVDPLPVITALWREASDYSDLIEIYNLRDSSPLLGFLSGVDVKGRHLSSSDAPRLGFGGMSWSEWLTTKPKSWRDKLKYYRNRLSKIGALTFEQVSPDDALAHASWCVETKRAWLDAHKIGDSWLREPPAIPFFAETIGQDAGVEGFALKVDGQTVAGCLCLIGGNALEFFLTVYDEAWAAHSPGNVLIEFLAQWCAERGLDLDFRFPPMAYKAHWANAGETVHSLALALTDEGAKALHRRQRQAEIRRMKSGAKKMLLKALKRA